MSDKGTPVVLTHGGAGAPSKWSDGCRRAAEAAMAVVENGKSALEAAVAATVILEDDPRFNAGTGCVLREDGKTVEADAGLMDSEGRIGAVCALSEVKNPILAAEKVIPTRHLLLSGGGAAAFAEKHGLRNGNPPTGRAIAAFNGEPCDTVGAVVRDGKGRFAAASSTGGIRGAMVGRVGDSPLPGCGYWAGPLGAVTATGHGEEIARKLLCRTVYGYLESGMPPEEACKQGVALYPKETSIGILAVTKTAHGWAANRDMAQAVLL
jgi:isoaspartyl peptidase/L-asparaginase-like protein (Ntn-hydrolase superfamily)